MARRRTHGLLRTIALIVVVSAAAILLADFYLASTTGIPWWFPSLNLL